MQRLSKTAKDLKFTFGIPVGEKGDKGVKGRKAIRVQTALVRHRNVGIDAFGNGITVTDNDTATPAVAAKSGDNSITVDGDGIKVKVKSGGGITVDSDGLSASSSGGDFWNSRRYFRTQAQERR